MSNELEMTVEMKEVATNVYLSENGEILITFEPSEDTDKWIVRRLDLNNSWRIFSISDAYEKADNAANILAEQIVEAKREIEKNESEKYEPDVDIDYVEDTYELIFYKKYEGQFKAQPVKIFLDCDNNTMKVETCVDDCWTNAVQNNLTLRFDINNKLSGCLINKLLDEIAPYVDKLRDGFDTKWNGHNYIGVFNDDYDELSDKIENICDSYDNDSYDNDLEVWDAEDYFNGECLEVNAKTTDDELDKIIESYQPLESDNIYVSGCWEYLTNYRDELKEESENNN